MTKRGKIILGIVLSLFGLLTVFNTLMIWNLVEAYRAEHGTVDLSRGIYMNALLNNDEETLARETYYDYVRDILKDEPSILMDEPAILLANPSIKPIVARVMAEEPIVLESNLSLITLHPDLLELEPALADRVEEYLGQEQMINSYPGLRKLIQNLSS